MVLFDIPDIRLFWSGDDRFLRQFKAGDLKARFKSYSKFPPCYKDVAFWVSDSFTENNLCEVVRGIAGDLVEEVKLIDDFTHPKTVRFKWGEGAVWAWSLARAWGAPAASPPKRSHLRSLHPLPSLQGKTSNCYRIAYRSMERSLTDDEINALQDEVRSTIADKLKVELR